MAVSEKRKNYTEFLQKLREECNKRPAQECKICPLNPACSLGFNNLSDEKIKEVVDVIMG